MGDAVRRQGGVEARVLRAKLTAPTLASGSVARTEIAELVARAGMPRLILFRAPAGYGKTTAMLQYLDSLRSAGVAAAWLSLDPLDDDFRRLLVHLIAAFDLLLASRDAAEPVSPRDPAGSNLDSLALDLMDRIANCPHRFTLFIDEFEAVSDRSIDDLLRLILSRMPAGGQLAIASRKSPELQLERLRAQEQLLEIDQLRLRFSREEAAALLRASPGLALSEDAVTRLHGATEGWPAALWLAATAMENRSRPDAFIAGFSGSNASVVDYLAEEVLFRQTDAMQEFLLKTSMLHELQGPLCDAVCGRSDSAAVLARLERSNVCVTLQDSERRLYRYHGLFADFLKDQLRRLYPDEIPALHLRAAKWYEAAGRWTPAIEHALASGQVAYTLSLLEGHASRLLFQGRFRLLARWLDALPPEHLRAKPRLRVAHISALTFTGRSAQALRMLEALAGEEAAVELGADVRDELKFLHPYILMILDQHAEGHAIAGAVALDRSAAESFSYNILATTLAAWKLAINRPAEAVALLDYSPREGEEGSRLFPRVYAVRLEGCIELVQCRVRQAIAHFRAALGAAAAARYGSRSTALYLAESLYEIDELEEVEQLLALYLPITLEYMQPDAVIISHLLQARIAFDRGDVDHAFWRLSELEYVGRYSKLPRVRAAAHLERARIALLREDAAEAQAYFERASNPEAWSGTRGMIMPANDVETLALCRYRLAAQGAGRAPALQALRADIRSALAALRYRRALKLNILLSRLLSASGQQRLAMRALAEALKVAAREGMVRTFLDEGGAVLELLREFRLQRGADADPALDAFIARILARGDGRVAKPPEEQDRGFTPASLTARELQILESLALGLPDADIAKNLFVATTTVRTHARRIYAKLGAGNRLQAVASGRRLGLIK